MRNKLLAFVTAMIVTIGGLFTAKHHDVVLYAQTLPYTLTVSWSASTDAAATYNCYLDGVLQVTGTSPTALSCQFPVPTLGSHTVGVTATDPANVPAESTPSTLAFTLKQTPGPSGVKVK